MVLKNKIITDGVRVFHSKDIVRHFKYETLTEEEKLQNKYTYMILGIVNHTETGEQMVHYMALYGNFDEYVRPLEMFMSKVDRNKYPNIKQKYRLEKVEIE